MKEKDENSKNSNPIQKNRIASVILHPETCNIRGLSGI